MRPIRILCEDGTVLAERAWAAQGWRERGRGWLGRASLEPGEALLLSPAAAIHTLGMRFSLDLAFLDKQGRVLKLYEDLKPGRLAWGPWRLWVGGLRALELPQGSLAASK